MLYRQCQCEVWPGPGMKHILQGMQPKWDLERNTDLYKKAERCEEMYSNGRQPKPLSEDSLSAGARMMHTNSLQRTGSAQGITEGGSHRRA